MILKRTLCLAAALTLAAGALGAGPGAGVKVLAAHVTGDGPLALVLLLDNGTPSDISDDTMLFCVGEGNLAGPSVGGDGDRIVLEACYLADPASLCNIMQIWETALDTPTLTRCTM
jgi:hypothetical protein